MQGSEQEDSANADTATAEDNQETEPDACWILSLVVEQSALQRAGCGKAARPVLQRGLSFKGQVYSTGCGQQNLLDGSFFLDFCLKVTYTVLV